MHYINTCVSVMIINNSISPMQLTFAWAQLVNLWMASIVLGILSWVFDTKRHYPVWLLSLPKALQVFLSIFLGILIEEVYVANAFRKITAKMIKTMKTEAEYDMLSEEDKRTVKKYFTARKAVEKNSMKLLQVESSVQRRVRNRKSKLNFQNSI